MVYGPLLALPWAQRVPIIRAVKAGVIIVDPVQAPLIARFAHWQTRRFVVLAAVGAVVAALCAAELLVDGPRFPEFYGIAGIVGSAAGIFRVQRCRRVRTQALAASPAPND